MTTYVNQTQLAEQFGISFEEIDKILIEHGLKSGEFATQKAIGDGYATFQATSAPFNHWNPLKISELTGKRLQDEIGFHVDQVLFCLQYAGDSYLHAGKGNMAMLIATQAYKDVPRDLWNAVKESVDKAMMGGEREVCGKCGRTSPTPAMTMAKATKHVMSDDEYKTLFRCWRCKPDDPFMQVRRDQEAAVRAITSAGLETLYTNYNLELKDTDAKLWAGAVDDAIDFFIGNCSNPTHFGRLDEFIENRTDDQAMLEFRYSGFEEFDEDRSRAFLQFAYKTVAGVLLKEAA